MGAGRTGLKACVLPSIHVCSSQLCKLAAAQSHQHSSTSTAALPAHTSYAQKKGARQASDTGAV